ncbi:hypothetical protein [Dactylosporangium salmoneum]|uniref:Uncharacterized protein n=1 Tax=Dactylosporangium salmoneum TaxID=53361 RepID=A0ABP5UHC2_9ACTN
MNACRRSRRFAEQRDAVGERTFEDESGGWRGWPRICGTNVAAAPGRADHVLGDDSPAGLADAKVKTGLMPTRGAAAASIPQ